MKTGPVLRITIAIALLAIPLLEACGSEEKPAAANTTVRDSAGIRIVENVPGKGPADAWRVSDSAVLTIGSIEGDSAYLLFRVTAARRLHDGRILIANAGTQQLRFYDSTGTYLSASGGKGEGPGEFQTIDRLYTTRGDTIVAFELYPQRFSVFDAAGRFVRSFQAPKIGDLIWARPIGVFEDGSVLVYLQAGVSMVSEDVVHPKAFFYRLDWTGSPVDTLGEFPSTPYATQVVGGGAISIRTLPFGPTPRFTVAGERFFWGFPDAFSIGEYTRKGRLRQIVRLRRDNAPVTKADIARLLAPLDSGSAESAPSRKAAREYYDRIGFPETMPAYGSILADGDGDLWVPDYKPFPDSPRRWSVFAPDGTLLGTVDLSPSLSVMQIGADFVLGKTTSELGIERIEMYRLEKGSGG